jgi:hypothetical protein
MSGGTDEVYFSGARRSIHGAAHDAQGFIRRFDVEESGAGEIHVQDDEDRRGGKDGKDAGGTS